MKDRRQRLGARLRTLRQARSMTQEQLAEHAGLHPTYVAKIEAGARLPSLEALERLAAALHVPLSSIVGAMDEIEETVAAPEDRLIADLKDLLRECSEGQMNLLWDFAKLLKQYQVSLPATK
ncbi:MAG: helix-turn-helix transcriptional regulator [Clostridia bacterium]|nr:helix-turn-helix domain-containing protein [Clostridia bacterium]MDH7572128.1 helix-turn-helix transcriptional regulator [Clostridia bacterium]